MYYLLLLLLFFFLGGGFKFLTSFLWYLNYIKHFHKSVSDIEPSSDSGLLPN